MIDDAENWNNNDDLQHRSYDYQCHTCGER